MKDDTNDDNTSIIRRPSSNKYTFRQFQEKAAELFKASGASVDTNSTAYTCVVSLVSICRQTINPRVIKDSFTSMIDRNSTILSPSGKKPVEKSNNMCPLPAKPRNHGRPTSLRKRSGAEIYRSGWNPSRNKKEKACCGFCKQSIGHRYFQCEHLKAFGSPVRLKGDLLTIWIADLKNPESLQTPTEPLPAGSITEKKPLLQSIPKETVWLVIEKNAS